MKIRYSLIALLTFFSCTPQANPGDSNQEGDQTQQEPWQEQVFERNSADPADEVIDIASLPQITDGCTVQVTREYIEKFLSEVSYPDKDYSYTKILEYPGGYNDVNATELPPVTHADKPALFVIKWTADQSAGELKLTLKDASWSRDYKIAAGADSQVITNLRPNANYTYSVAAKDGGKVLASGSFTTTGSIHQCFFPWNVRNCRDLGGWETYDGKHVKYRKIYRGGRMEGSTMSREGREEILAEGIKAQLELRGKSDMLKWCALGENYAFCNPCIENGGTSMLNNDMEKTKACFDFVLKCVREDKPVYFHCSLGRDRTGTLAALLLGVLGVKEGDISQEYELSYFAPYGWSIAYSEKNKYFKNNRKTEYRSVAGIFWNKGKKSDGTYERFDKCVENYLIEIGVPQADIAEFRSLMLED